MAICVLPAQMQRIYAQNVADQSYAYTIDVSLEVRHLELLSSR